ncbi:MAG: macro domain-containing protein [Bdellovibrionales bacterium]|nr:macro domain-containing protein [Bdellovibrionales bacterium]
MVTFVKGDIFKSPAQVLTNTVNCVGVMGKGVALEFKNRYPQMFNDYKAKCDQGNVKPGQPYLWEDDSAQVLNFPTKRNWRDNSLLQDVEDGLKHLASSYEQMGIQSIAMPALGCGLGGLKWSEVQPLIVKHLGALPDLDVYVYEPQGVTAIRSDVDGRDSDAEFAAEKISARQPEV